ncbi:ribosome maturation factor RimM [Pelagibius sp. CAU 1746]|uniref:ribosome maturation factor RimM n=1 Tax=Pelagibius sp. CAU 1746 TaxID=3140370 RepID=UPI00325BD65F
MAEDRAGPDLVCLGVMVGAHGVRGLVKVKTFTEAPEDVAAYGPVSDKAGRRRWTLQVTGPAPGKRDVVLAKVEGVGDRDAAQALHGTELYVERSALPALAEEETFYHADLIGLSVEDPEGRELGKVAAVENYGAGDFLEVVRKGDGKGGGKTLLLAFTRAVVPEVDIAGGRLVALPPAEIEVPPEGARPGAEEEPET